MLLKKIFLMENLSNTRTETPNETTLFFEIPNIISEKDVTIALGQEKNASFEFR